MSGLPKPPLLLLLALLLALPLLLALAPSLTLSVWPAFRVKSDPRPVIPRTSSLLCVSRLSSLRREREGR